MIVYGNGVRFTDPVDDVLYAAHRKSFYIANGKNKPTWLSDFPGHVIGHAQQEYLQAPKTVGQLPRLPDDQWVRELIGWERYAFTYYQILFSDYAVGHKVRYPGADGYCKLHRRLESGSCAG
ncbi:hypothetical protein K469DRAFT_695786 [Zopfia rhizophila CBS 207.26]|uniref:Uncharacterized protein n=1 Tax=Zopfia rhizophila CBS 207.26 TaxID=1314779 RepID=A0A6A6DIB2_9PEZI|nr:hypothetical protein K469DRAFT_695786 [Zopfia rhizophila CBS 207.26]